MFCFFNRTFFKSALTTPRYVITFQHECNQNSTWKCTVFIHIHIYMQTYNQLNTFSSKMKLQLLTLGPMVSPQVPTMALCALSSLSVVSIKQRVIQGSNIGLTVAWSEMQKQPKETGVSI